MLYFFKCFFKLLHAPREVSMYNSTYLHRFLRMATGLTYIFDSLHVVESENQ